MDRTTNLIVGYGIRHLCLSV